MGNNGVLDSNIKIQPSPDGLAQAFILSEKFLQGAPSTLVLGDNIFFGDGLSKLLNEASKQTVGATVFGYHVINPESYGVVDFKKNGTVKSIIEKPKTPKSNYAVTGLYFVDATTPQRAKEIKSSAHGELEITTFLETYLFEETLKVAKIRERLRMA